MPDEEKDVDVAVPAPPPAQSKRKQIILIVVLVLVGLALAAGISLFVVTKFMGDIPGGNGGGYEEGGEPRYHDAGVFVKIGDPKEGILVNVGGPRSGKYLKASIIVEFNPAKKSVINPDTNTLQRNAIPALDQT